MKGHRKGGYCLKNNCMITAEHSGKYQDIKYEKVNENEE